MKKLYFLLITLLISSFSFGQTTVFQESFETGNSATASETCNDGFSDFFTRTDGSDISSNYVVSGMDGTFFFAAQDTDGAPCTSPIQTLLFSGINISTFTNMTFAILVAEDDASDGNEDWDADTNVLIEINIDGAGYTNLLQFSGGGSTNTAPGLDADFDGTADGTLLTSTFQEFTAPVGMGSSADIRITFNNLNAGDEDIAIDNIRLVDNFVANTNPSLTITAPSEGATLPPTASTSMDIVFTVQNFVVASAGNGDGHIHYKVDNGSNIVKMDTNPITLTGLSAGAHSVFMQLVDDNHTPISPAVEATVNFSIAPLTQVSTITALRAGTQGDYYELTGEAIVTYTRTSRNQKYVEDPASAARNGNAKNASGSGILIDDSAGTITTTYAIGDGITGLKGRLSSFSGVLQFVPLEDPGAASSTGNTVTPEVVTNSELAANWENYESELVEIKSATFVGATGNFAASTNYTINDGTADLTFRTNFSEADYIGSPIPTTPQNLVVFVGEFNGTPQVVARGLADITLRVERNAIAGFSLYPNPVTNGILTINTFSNADKKIQIFDILGKQVISTNLRGKELNVSKLNSGIYILKILEEGKTATRKLVIK